MENPKLQIKGSNHGHVANFRNTWTLVLALFATACVSIPKETVTLSQAIGNDLKKLHLSHQNLVEIHYGKIKQEVNDFVDNVYAPFVIHYVLSKELEKHKKGSPSLYSSIEAAGKTAGKEETEEALNVMVEFQEAAHAQIESKRQELLTPIQQQQSRILARINQSYDGAIYANSTITGYLESIRKVKDAQQEALSRIGLPGADTVLTNKIIKVSEGVHKALEKGKEIDVKSDDAIKKLEDVSEKIKNLLQ
jgi:hypothetical protein